MRFSLEKIKKISCATFSGRFNTQRVAGLDALTTNKTTNNNTMAKALSKSQIAAAIAEKNGITKRQAQEILETLVDLAYKNAKNSFTLPGLGKLVLVNRKARIGRNPATGEQINIPAKRVVKFRVAKAAKDAILGGK
jgi:DNA-binding protein HU-beta